jgi:hypothetical protein
MYANRTKLSQDELLLGLAELETIIASPAQQRDVQKAQALTMYIARNAANGRIANLAMQAMSAVLASPVAASELEANGKLLVLLCQLTAEIRASPKTGAVLA